MRTLSELAVLGRPLRKLFYRQLTIHSDKEELRQILTQNSRLVIVLNHGPALGPGAALLGVLQLLAENGGEARRILGVTWKHFYKVPLLRHVFAFVTQTNRGLSVEELVSKLNAGVVDDVLIMPEGENCNFGDGEAVQPFLSPRFVEIALRTGAPILIVAHRGGRYWSRYLPGAASYLAKLHWLPERTRQLAKSAGGINLPRLRLRALDEYPWFATLYHPQMTLAEFEAANAQARNDLLHQEAERVRSQMQSMLMALPDPVAEG